uniref:Galactosylgalactosylxylosylprotein 3-beta-glucuronosyltransferase n=1 Tax=Haemonchus contortus TaxID=6289 RepID=A0A7I4YPJ8_HAECO
MMNSLVRMAKRSSLTSLVCLTLVVAFLTIAATSHNRNRLMFDEKMDALPVPLIIVITPTYKRPTRLADMTRMSNTLRLVPHVHWIAVEDANYTVPYVEDILRRTMHSYTYVAARTPEGYPKRGWYQRTTALQLLRNNTVSVMKNYKEGVVYFGDDDNAYDTRLFTDYIRKVKKLGMWAVGLSGGTPVESPEVMNGTVVGYKVKWGPKRKFAVDMAGFAINLNFILNTTAVFGKSCRSGFGAPEPCFLEDMGFSQDDIEPFGLDEEMAPKKHDVLVWHTRTTQPKFKGETPDAYDGFVVEV